MKILVMEDDVALSFALAKDLQEAGHEVQTCCGASQAQIELGLEKYDILITDIVVKEMDRCVPNGGISLIGWVRANHSIKDLPIIAISGAVAYRGMQSILSTADVVGADVGIAKPFQLADILGAIDNLTALDRKVG